mmetsp:Transcript_47424/g.94639  ORF Transcript_47424/g.94639 Transcript_47424/m.94639 type:complete len:237 (-) Transcript_47424:383-1093(-)|eukprot:CAMPEP_0174729278 /NCGR_PEP_ID=MMETSP1094-20130205/53414_1 /TAXON_ID=156173 /ORGANISM="Chrysochromulina brevifilum, Strain UTEX LB 985" /LENGTH=236 /DNA_ID=CAMNT_0015931367 /DNA_START=92 /DNA_END=802 /DNA_ORIENTATION=+
MASGRAGAGVLLLLFSAIGTWWLLSPGKEPIRPRLGSPKQFTDKVVKEMKVDAKEPSRNLSAQSDSSSNYLVEKLTLIQSNLADMIRIQKSWDAKAPYIPFDKEWPDALKKKLNVSRLMKPEWRKSELADLEQKLSKMKRRISIPKTASEPSIGNNNKWQNRYKRLQVDLTEMNKIMNGWPKNFSPIPIDGSWPASISDRLKFTRNLKPADRALVLEDNIKKLAKIKAWLTQERRV